MTPTERSTLIAVFVDRGQADRAIDELRRADMSYGQIRLVERGAGFFDSLKGWFTGMETTSTITVEDLRKLGVAEQDASFYQSELQAGHCLVLVNAHGNLELALSILHQNGAYDISARLRTTQPTVPVGTQEPGVRPEPSTSTVPAEAPTPPVPAEQQGPSEQSSSARRVPPEAPALIVPPEPARPE